MPELQTVILIDGSDNPVALRMDKAERQTYIAQGRAGDTARNFKFSHMEGDVAVYRLLSDGLTDSLFKRSASAEADKFLHPEKYINIGKQGGLTNREREELEQYRAKHGPLTKE